MRAFTFRNVGPFRMQARASTIAVPNGPPKEHLYTFYVATWTGGVFKTTNGGVTFTPVFDRQNKLTIGAVAIAPSNSRIVWVGTGDTRGARSSFRGDGIYKSDDAGETWTNMGLHDSHHISRVVIHPTNPDIVYVGVMGHLYSPNEERGVFKSTDGGKTWKRSFFVNDKLGVIDLVMNPQKPDVLYAATYDMQRTPWMNRNAGPDSAHLQDRGWRRRPGRSSRTDCPPAASARSASISTRRIRRSSTRRSSTPTRVPRLARLADARADSEPGSWAARCIAPTTAARPGRKSTSTEDDLTPKGSGYIGSGDEDCDGFTQVRIDPNNDQHVFMVSNSLLDSTDGGKTWRGGGGSRPPGLFPNIFGDVRTFWIDPQNSDRMIIGDDGGFSLSHDGGKSSDHISHLPIGEPYAVGYDMEDPYNIYASLQDHEDWKGPSIGPMGFTSLLDWFAISSGDGMHTRVDPADSRWAYTTSEWGGVFRTDQKLGYRVNIRPTRPGGGPPYRSIWGTPLHVSPHNGSILYTGGEVLLKSVDRGDHWTEISPDLSTNDPAILAPSGRARRAASPLLDGHLDDLGVAGHRGRDLGRHERREGAPDEERRRGLDGSDGGRCRRRRAEGYVREHRCRLHARGRAAPTSRRAATRWMTSILTCIRPTISARPGARSRATCRTRPIHIVWEDNRNPDLLFVGTGGGVFVTINRGKRWVKLNNNIPNVPVLDLAVHPRERDLIVAAMGRNVYVTNIAPLQELSDAVLAKDVHLFSIKPAVQRVTWSFGANDRLFSQRYLITPNEDIGMAIRYYLKTARTDGATVVITDIHGKEVARLKGESAAGINTVYWNMLAPPAPGATGRGGGRVVVRATLRNCGRLSVTTWSPWKSEDRS